MKVANYVFSALALSIVCTLAAQAAINQPHEILEPIGPGVKSLESHLPGMPVVRDEDIYPLERLVVTQEKKREMAFRTIRMGLERGRSDDPRRRNEIVCRFTSLLGTRITKRVECATNQAWNFWREQTTRDIFGLSGQSFTPYITHFEPIYYITSATRGKIIGLMKQITDSDSDLENADKLRKYVMSQAVGFTHSQQGYDNDTIVKFAQAFRAVHGGNISSARFEEVSDSRAAAAVRNSGLDVETYNRIVTDTAQDSVLRRAVLRALSVGI